MSVSLSSMILTLKQGTIPTPRCLEGFDSRRVISYAVQAFDSVGVRLNVGAWRSLTPSGSYTYAISVAIRTGVRPNWMREAALGTSRRGPATLSLAHAS